VAVFDGEEPPEEAEDPDDPDDPDEDPDEEPVTELRLVTGLHFAAELADLSVALYGSHERAPDEESCTRAVVEAKYVAPASTVDGPATVWVVLVWTSL
jgi:hypothetical protein